MTTTDSTTPARRVLITRVAGFIGAPVASRLAGLGCEVLGCDNFNDHHDPKLKRARAGVAGAAADRLH